MASADAPAAPNMLRAERFRILVPLCADAGSRKTLIYLILTLNHMYPDYDFSNLRAHVRAAPTP